MCRELGVGFRTGSKKSEVLISQLNEMSDRRTTPLLIMNSLGDPQMLEEARSKREVVKRKLEEAILLVPLEKRESDPGLNAIRQELDYEELKIKYAESGWIFTGMIPKGLDSIYLERMAVLV